MIRMTLVGTTYITADAFRDRYEHAAPGWAFVYATGDLARACELEADARKLRDTVQHYADTKKIVLTQRPRPDLQMKHTGGRAFDYLATKRAEEKYKK
jgi:hypothetical protein